MSKKKADTKPTFAALPAIDAILFEEPPPAPLNESRVGLWARRLQQLLDHPGKWARVAEGKNYKIVSSMVGHLRQGRTKFPVGEFEFLARATKLDRTGKPAPDAKGLVYARYLGPPDPKKRTVLTTGRRVAKARNGISFYKWLEQYRNVRGDYRGEMARYAYSDPSWPRNGPVNTFKHIQNYLKGKPLKGFEVDQLDAAWKDYEVAREHLGK